MPRAKPQRQPAKKPNSPTSVSPAVIRDLQKRAKVVRRQVAKDREQIETEAREAVEAAAAEGKLTKLTLLLRPDEQQVLDALDRYGAEHGLKSRSQVLRAALSQLLKIDLDQPHWGWTAGRSRRPT